LIGRLDQSAAKRRLSSKLGVDDARKLTAYLRKHYEVAWLCVGIGRKEIEELVAGALGARSLAEARVSKR
jgi:hypothetical protein